jgi:hypothetical protein
MKKTGFIFACIFLTLVNCAYASVALRTGTYQLSGGNSNWGGSAYQGEVIIRQQGENYSLTWRIGSRQAQVGIGILHHDILSVSFFDSLTQAWGVVSYRIVRDGELEGKWTMFDSYTQKPEYLIWKNYSTY